MKKLWIVFLSTALMFTTGCGSSKQEAPQTQTDEENTETASEETKTEEPAAETAETPVTDPGASYTDASAFAGFDSYSADYSGPVTEQDFVSSEVVFGKTLLREHYTGTINETEQLDDVTHDDTKEVDMVEPGAVAKVETSYLSTFGKTIEFFVYNNTGAPAKPEDCVMIGMENEAARNITFSNGITLIMAEAYMSPEDPAEAVKAVLGEPFETDESGYTTEYTWKDQTGDHIFELTVNDAEGSWQVIEYEYQNFSFQK